MEPQRIDPALRADLRTRLDGAQVAPEIAHLALAACDGPPALEAVLAGEPVPEPGSADDGATREIWLESLTVEGIRGIRGPVTLELDPEPGLVVVAARNGSGKSSLAEGLEALILGKAERWRGRASTFGAGWQNLHHDGVRRVRATFRVSGRPEALRVERRWAGDQPDQSELFVDDAPAADVAAWGGRSLAGAWCPLLACGQVARRLEDERPSGVFDTIARVTGLDALHEACDHLRAAAAPRAKRAEASEEARRALVAELQRHSDPRAPRCQALLDVEGEPDAYALGRVLADPGDDDALHDLARLRRLAGAAVPDADEGERRGDELRARLDEVARLADDAAAHGERLAQVLDAALHVHEDGARDCPVCGTPGVLDEPWAQDARERAARAREAGRRLREARGELDAAETRARGFVQEVAAPAEASLLLPEEQETVAVWREGASLAAGPLALHLAYRWAPVGVVLRSARDRAAARLDALQRDWLPLARRIRDWLDERAAAVVAGDEAERLRDAEALLKQTEEELRSARFAPIRELSLEIWRDLRQQSSVNLLDLAMAGGRTRRRLDLRAEVDGVESHALPVASQGELNALALSVFIPRTTQAESPFRFVLIDDPIQAMDAFRIDGLARVLGALAKTRQTLVLTHDERLTASLRCQGIEASVVGVHRKQRSEVALEERSDPIRQYLEEGARILSAGALAEEVRGGLALAFCRDALEAALLRRIRRRNLAEGHGSSHDDLEELLTRCTLRDLAALALTGDRRRGGEVEERLRQATGRPELAELLDVLNQGAHRGVPDGVRPGVVLDRTRALVAALQGAG